MKRFATTALLLLGLASNGKDASAEAPPGQIAISPSIVEMAVDSKPVNGSIRMQNLQNEPVRVKVEVYNWTLDEQNNVKLIPSYPQSLDHWLLISPVSFTLEPGSSQVIRYSVRPNVKPEAGEHRAIVYLTQQAMDDGSQKSGVQVLFRYGMAMYGYSGAVLESAEIEGLTVDKGAMALRAVVRNTGNVHTRLTGDFTVWKAGTFPGFKAMKEMIAKGNGTARPEGFVASGTLHSSPVLPGHRRAITEKLGVTGATPGCVVAVTGKIGGRQIEKVFQ